MLNFPKIPKIALRKFSELSHSLWRSKRAKSTQDSFLLGGSSYIYMVEQNQLFLKSSKSIYMMEQDFSAPSAPYKGTPL